MPKKDRITTSEKIVVESSVSIWWWTFQTPGAYCSSIDEWKTKTGAVRSARAFASKFKDEPQIVVEE